MFKGIKSEFKTEIITIIIGLLFSATAYICALDGKFAPWGKVQSFYLIESNDPEAFWNAVFQHVYVGFIIAGCGVLMIYLQKNKKA